MANEWIKMDCELPNKAEVFKLSRILGINRFEVVGRLHAFWSFFDKHSVDGLVDVSENDVDADVVAMPGFCKALVDVGWLLKTSTGLQIPKHDRHNGNGAKTRNLKSERQARWRENQKKKAPNECRRYVDANVERKASTREEKRREDINTPPLTPPGVGEFPFAGSVLDVPEVREAWNRFERYRKERKFPPWKPSTIEANLKAWSRYPAAVIVAAIDKSIRMSWQGIFPEKIKPEKSDQTSTSAIQNAFEIIRNREVNHATG